MRFLNILSWILFGIAFLAGVAMLFFQFAPSREWTTELGYPLAAGMYRVIAGIALLTATLVRLLMGGVRKLDEYPSLLDYGER